MKKNIFNLLFLLLISLSSYSQTDNFQIQKSVINMKENLEKIKEENYNVL